MPFCSTKDCVSKQIALDREVNREEDDLIYCREARCKSRRSGIRPSP